MSEQELDRLFRKEFKELTNNLIWQNDRGEYEVFDRFKIISQQPYFRVMIGERLVGTFSSSKTAMSWCIAAKNNQSSLAKEIFLLDQKLINLTNDISIRARIGDRGKTAEFREVIETKLETKIIRKKQIESELNKCVRYAKYTQQKEFNNEINRASRQARAARRKGI